MVYHPDIIEFITAKHDEGIIENANISVFVDDAFMHKVENNEKYWTEFNGKKYHEYNARDIFDLIVERAWINGDPGVLFRDRMGDSPYKTTGQRIYGTNPCSEQGLPANGACNLGSIDLSKFVSKYGEVDWEKLKVAVRYGVRFLDDVIDKTVYPTDKIRDWSLANRPIGLGKLI